MQLSWARGALRGLGGLLFAIGALVLLIRKSHGETWGEGARFFVVAIPAALLYVLALVEDPRARGTGSAALMIVVSLLLTPVALFELLTWAGASTNHLLYDAAVFAVTGVLAGYACVRARVPYAAFLSALAWLAAWLFLWAKLKHDASADTYRWLLVVAAVVLAAIAGALALPDRDAGAAASRLRVMAAREVGTIAGLAAIAAGVFGVVVGSVLAPFVLIGGAVSKSSSSGVGGEVVHHSTPLPSPLSHAGLQHPGWNIYLLVVCLLLAYLAARTRLRGAGYLAAIGVFAFVLSAGLQLTGLEQGHTPGSSAGGWPIVLLILGLVALGCSWLVRARPPGESVADGA